MLSESRQKQLKESLDNGKALLNSENQMYAYLHHYGEMPGKNYSGRTQDLSYIKNNTAAGTSQHV